MSGCTCVSGECINLNAFSRSLDICPKCGYDSSHECSDSCIAVDRFKPYGVCDTCGNSALQDGYDRCPARSPSPATAPPPSPPSSGAQPTIEGTSNKDDGGTCFPETSTVQLENGTRKLMKDLSIGDRVQVGTNAYSTVFMFTHRDSAAHHDFVELRTNSGHTIQLTDGHHIYINEHLQAARNARVGDRLIADDGSAVLVSSTAKIKAKGLYNPQTMHGDVVVDGIVTSTYTEAIQYSAAHSMLSPIRMIYRACGLTTNILEQSSPQNV